MTMTDAYNVNADEIWLKYANKELVTEKEIKIKAIKPTIGSKVETMKFHPQYNFKMHKKSDIIVIGAGGTGGYVVRDLARYIFSKKKNFDIRMIIIDHDKVEERNLLRQNFVTQDLGHLKAEVLAQRYSAAFGVEIVSVTKKADITLLNEQHKLAHGRDMIIIGCVDNNIARRGIHDFIKQKCNRYGSNHISAWIDSGNEKTSGQVIVGAPAGQCDSYLPFVTQYYPEILDPNSDPKEKISCAERAVQDIQSIFVNLTAANHVLNFINTIYSGNKTSIHGVNFGINGATNPIYLQKKMTNDTAWREREAIWSS